nr:MAG TPA: hypothetical protein [Caudoviricetes sp.]
MHFISSPFLELSVTYYKLLVNSLFIKNLLDGLKKPGGHA